MTHPDARRAFTVVEAMVGLIIGLLVCGMAFGLYRFSVVSTQGTIGPQLGLQTASRAALIKLIEQIQESMEITRPLQGSTLNYFVAKDKFDQIVVGYAAQEPGGAPGSQSLYLYTYDYAGNPGTQIKLLDGVDRVAFTTLSPGVLQVHLTLKEQGKDYTLLTAIRARNILAEGEL